jgi:predicted transposase YdaD
VTSTPHDALFRSIFGQPAQARAELRAVLPAELRARLDLESLERIDASFIDPSLRSTAADLLFAVDRRGTHGATPTLGGSRRSCRC